MVISLGLAGSAPAAGGDGAGDPFIRQSTVQDETASFPATGESAASESDARAGQYTPVSERMYEYPSGDATPICVNPPR